MIEIPEELRSVFTVTSANATASTSSRPPRQSSRTTPLPPARPTTSPSSRRSREGDQRLAVDRDHRCGQVPVPVDRGRPGGEHRERRREGRRHRGGRAGLRRDRPRRPPRRPAHRRDRHRPPERLLRDYRRFEAGPSRSVDRPPRNVGPGPRRDTAVSWSPKSHRNPTPSPSSGARCPSPTGIDRRWPTPPTIPGVSRTLASRGRRVNRPRGWWRPRRRGRSLSPPGRR